MASNLCSLHPTDPIFKNILGDALLAEGRHSEAEQWYNSAVSEDERNQDVEDPKFLVHRAYCAACSSPIVGIRSKCEEPTCSKYSWCMTCADVRGSVGSSCSHNRLIQIPATRSNVRAMLALWESRSTRGNAVVPVRRRTR